MSSGDWTLEQRGPIAAGMLVGAYGIEKPIGEGGMGAVYRALDNKLNRPRPPLGDPRYSSNQLGNAYAGNDPSVYVYTYTKQDFQGNLFRIPLH